MGATMDEETQNVINNLKEYVQDLAAELDQLRNQFRELEGRVNRLDYPSTR